MRGEHEAGFLSTHNILTVYQYDQALSTQLLLNRILSSVMLKPTSVV